MEKSCRTLWVLVLLLILLSSLLHNADAKTKMCWSKCRIRCKRAKVKGKCFNACNGCCAKCKCVPAWGKIHQCPCYRHIHKCP